MRIGLAESGMQLAGSPLHLPPEPVCRASAGSASRTGTVDVIVPVYRGVDETRACLESVISAQCRTPHRLIVVDDASPETAIAEMLSELAQRHPMTRLTNPFNLGFTATVNRAMSLACDRDVVLLNADTVVPPGWLDRLRHACHAASDTGTVTPLTDNAPLVGMEGATVDRSVEAVDRAVQESWPGQTVELPTGIGFCLYIRADCAQQTGLLDAAAYGHGYGEETDFCLRAARRGWRHRVALDVFVAHRGGRSFGARKAALVHRNMAEVARRFPEYRPGLARFRDNDPLRRHRALLLGRDGAEPKAEVTGAGPDRDALNRTDAACPVAGGMHVAVLSGAASAQGWARLRRLSRLAALHAPWLTFFVLQPTPDDASLIGSGRVHVLGAVEPAHHAALTRALGCHWTLELGASGGPDADAALFAALADRTG